MKFLNGDAVIGFADSKAPVKFRAVPKEHVPLHQRERRVADSWWQFTLLVDDIGLVEDVAARTLRSR